MTIIEILVENAWLCMDNDEDVTLMAEALKVGLMQELTSLSASSHDANSPGIDAAVRHIELMSTERR